MTTLNQFMDELASLKKVNPLEALHVQLEAEEISKRYETQHAELETDLGSAIKGHHGTVQTYLEDISHREFELRDQLATPTTGTIPGLSFRASRILRTFEADLAAEYKTHVTPTLRRYEAQLHDTLHLLPTENALPVGFPDLKSAKIENIVAVAAPGEAPVSRTPPKFVPTLTTVLAGEPPIIRTATPAPAPVRTAPAYVPTLTTVHNEAPVAAPEVTAAPDKWSTDVLIKTHFQIMEAARSAPAEKRQGLLNDVTIMRKEALEELASRVKTPETYENDRNLLKFADFLRGQAEDIKSRMVTDAHVAQSAQFKAERVPEVPQFMKPEKKSWFAQAKEKVGAFVEEKKALLVSTHVNEASARAREQLADAMPGFMKPVQKSWFSRATEKVGTFIKSHAAGFGTGVAVAAAGTAASFVTTDPVEKPFHNRGIQGVVTQVPADTVAPVAPTVLVAKAEPKAEVKAEVQPAPVAVPDAKVKTSAVKTAFAEKAFEPYKVPDSLKVTFNDGSTSRFDKNTWENAYKQVGLPFDLGAKSLTNG